MSYGVVEEGSSSFRGFPFCCHFIGFFSFVVEPDFGQCSPIFCTDSRRRLPLNAWTQGASCLSMHGVDAGGTAAAAGRRWAAAGSQTAAPKRMFTDLARSQTATPKRMFTDLARSQTATRFHKWAGNSSVEKHAVALCSRQ